MNKKDINYYLAILIIINIVSLIGKTLEDINQINKFRLMRIFQGEEKQYFLGRSIESLGDINNDGFSDFAIGVPGANDEKGRIDIYYGNSNPDSIKRKTLNGNILWNNFSKINNIGDINRDGNTDILIGSLDSKNIYSYCHIYSGNDTGWFEYRKSIVGEESYDGFGAFSGSGDFNGDGYSDFIIGAPNFDHQRGKVYIYLGSDTIPDQPYLTIQGDSSLSCFAGSVAGVGDVNNDGYDDFVVGAPIGDPEGIINAGYFKLYLGGVEIDTTPFIELSGYREYQGMGRTFCSGFFNGDTIRDFIVGSDGEAYLFFGSRDIDSTPDFIFGTPELPLGYLSYAGDINNDGYDDFLSSNPFYGYNNGYVDIYLGSQSFDTLFDYRIHGEWASYFGWRISAAGDVNGDGLDDFLIGEPHYFLGIQNQGRVYLFSGDSTLVRIDDSDNDSNVSQSFQIIGNYPNPFNDTTTIQYSVTTRGIFYINIYNISGQLVFQKKKIHSAPGQYSMTWNGIDGRGNGVSSGIYLVTIAYEANQYNPIKIMLLK